jgi:hypothetical protein
MTFPLVKDRVDETEEMCLQRTFSATFPFCIISDRGPRLHCSGWPLRNAGDPLLRASIQPNLYKFAKMIGTG